MGTTSFSGEIICVMANSDTSSRGSNLTCAEFWGRGVVREGCVRSCPGMVAVGGFSLNFEAIRSTSLDAVRFASNSTKKRPPASCDGHESYQ